MNIDLLEALVAVVQEGGYSRAARTLNLSQPAVYQRVQRLEAEVGAPVVTREGRRIRLTAVGQVVHSHAREVIRQMRLLDDALKETQAPDGMISLMAAHSLCEFPAPDICLGFQREHPDLMLDLRLSARPSRDIDRDVQSGRSDMGMHSDPTPVSGLVKDLFYEEEFVAVAWPEHPFEELEVVTPHDFEGERVILMRDPTYTFTQGVTEGWFAQAGVRVRSSLISNSYIGIRAFVERQAGVTIMPREHALQASHILMRPIVQPPVRRHYFVSRITPHETAAQRAFRAYVLSGDWVRETSAPVGGVRSAPPTAAPAVRTLPAGPRSSAEATPSLRLRRRSAR